MRGRWRGLLLITAAIIVSAVFIFDLTPWVRGGNGWRWEHHPLMRPIFGYVLLMALYVVQAWLMLTYRARPRTVLALAFFAAVVFPLIAVGLRDGDVLYTLFARTFSQVASMHQLAAAQIDWPGGEWRDWTAVMARIGSHVATSPPAFPAAYAFAGDVIDRLGISAPLARPLISALCTDYPLYDLTPAQVAAGWLGVLSPLWAAFTVFPIYALAKRVGGRGEFGALLWPLVPGLSAFAASTSTLFPIFTVLMLVPLAGAFTHRRFAAAGLIFGIATFTNFALLPLAALAGFFALTRWWLNTPRPPFINLLRLGATFVLAGLVPWGIWFALTGETPLDLLVQSFNAHFVLERPYAFWVWFHVWDWAVWSGLALAAAAIFAGSRSWRERITHPEMAAMTAALVLTVLTLTISGFTRGESGRIWLFFAPLLPVVLARADFDAAADWRPLGFAQAIITVALIYAVSAFNAPDVPPRPPLDSAQEGTPLATFASSDGGEFMLMSAVAGPPGKLLLTINGRTPTLTPVWFGLIAVDAENVLSASGPQQPLHDGSRLPSTCWVSGTTATVTLDLPPLDTLTSDQYFVSLAAYGYRAGEPPLTVTTADGQDTQIGIGPFQIPPD